MLMEIPKDKKVYFASDNHLGAPNSTDSLIREKKFVKWLNEIRGLNILEKICRNFLDEKAQPSFTTAK